MSYYIYEEVIRAITKNIKNEFGSTYRIEIEERKQGFTSPTFFVRMEKPTIINGLGLKDECNYIYDFPILIEYYNNNNYLDCMNTVSRLNACLEWITVSENNYLVRRYDSDYIISEGGILIFSIMYKMYLSPIPTTLDNTNTFQSFTKTDTVK